MNALTDESRDFRLKVDVDGLVSTLRAPESVHRLVMDMKPAGVSVGDFALTSMVNECITALMVRRDYRAIQGLLGTLFGPYVPSGTVTANGPARVPNGTSAEATGTNGTSADRKPPVKAAGGTR